MNSTWNLPPGTTACDVDGKPCQFCGSNLGCDCPFDEPESYGLTYRERIEYEKAGD